MGEHSSQTVSRQCQRLIAAPIPERRRIFHSRKPEYPDHLLAAKAVMDGSMTLGMMLAVQYILTVERSDRADDRVSAHGPGRQNQPGTIGEIHQQQDEESPKQSKISLLPARKDGGSESGLHYAGPHSERVLDEIDFHIPAGKVTAIVAPAAAAKPRCLNCCSAYPPTQGENLHRRHESQACQRTFLAQSMRGGDAGRVYLFRYDCQQYCGHLKWSIPKNSCMPRGWRIFRSSSNRCP